MSRRLTCWLLLAAVLTGQTSTVQAAGEEYSRQAADLVVTVDSRWAGCGHGGYYPLRVKVVNRGLERNLTFTFSGQTYQPLPTVRRSIRVAQNSTARLTLSVPCVGEGSYGTFKVYQDGRLIKEHTQTLNVADARSYDAPRTSLLLISPTNVDADAFETAINSMAAGGAGASSSYLSGYYGSVSEDHQIVGPEMLPESWIDYSGLDLVAISLKTLAGLSLEQRTAVLKWVHCGGQLIVTEVGAPAGQSQELARLLELDQHAAVGSEWQPAAPARRTKINIVETDEYGNVVTEVAAEGTADSEEELDGEESNAFAWSATEDTFASRSLMMGHVYAFPEDPFPGSPHDWAWFLKSVPDSQRTWTGRHGIAARRGSDEFLKFLIPSVKGVPVVAFLLLITVFTIVIGPLNYMWLWKRRRLYLLVLSIPAIALGTSIALFGYSAIAHGFSTKSRARTLTLLDQKSNTAVSMSRLALYSGLAPSDGLHFSPDTAVFPIWPENSTFESGAVDWTEQQTLINWLRSRTRTQFLTVSHRNERGRLQVSEPSSDRLSVKNGLEWALEALVVADEAGRLFYGSDIEAGASAELTPISGAQHTQFSGLLKQHPLRPPEASGNSGGFFDWSIDMRYRYSGVQPVRFETNLMERQLKELQRLEKSGGGLEPQSYAAVVRENPGIELGIEKTKPQVSLHVLMGRY